MNRPFLLALDLPGTIVAQETLSASIPRRSKDPA